MTAQILRFTKPIGLALLILMSGVAQEARAATAHTVELAPGDNVQARVNAEPAGTTFVLLAGVYRMQSVQPKNNDIFNGQGSAILNGSKLLKFEPGTAGSGLWAANATALAPGSGVCQSTHPLCNYDQDLFIDGVLQTPAAKSTGLKAGQWYFDRVAGKVYIATDPAGQTVELGMTQFAFSGIASGVQIESLTVEEYANRAQTGAVGAYKDGDGWIVSHVESRFNHGTGISLGPGGQILDSYSHNNGQMGIAIVNGANSKVIGNELSWNNYAGYATNWEAGGSKFWNTTNLWVETNYVHDNKGPGLWTDYNNTGTVYQSNTVVNNFASGIVHEISYSATIASNTVENNGGDPDSTSWNAQIVVANSSNVTVESNTVEVPASSGDGIDLINEQRGSGSQGEWLAAHNSVHNNKVVYLGGAGRTGIFDYLGHGTAVGNNFDHDQYILDEGGASHWMWFTKMTWKQLQSAGQETHGLCCS